MILLYNRLLYKRFLVYLLCDIYCGFPIYLLSQVCALCIVLSCLLTEDNGYASLLDSVLCPAFVTHSPKVCKYIFEFLDIFDSITQNLTIGSDVRVIDYWIPGAIFALLNNILVHWVEAYVAKGAEVLAEEEWAIETPNVESYWPTTPDCLRIEVDRRHNCPSKG